MSSMTPQRSGAVALDARVEGESRHWWLAIRPRTLSIALVPVLLGSLLGWAQGGPLVADLMLVAMLAAVLIQVGTNLHNDVADYERGADHPATRLGPPRASAEGWLPACAVRRAACLSFATAALLGGYLVWAGGWVILAIGIASISAGWAYSGGPRPIAYTALGEAFVFVFFGLVAVAGSYYLQTGRLDSVALLMGALVGMPAAAVLVVNNLRDTEQDRLAGRRTIAVLCGAGASRIEYTVLMLLPFVMLALLKPVLLRAPWSLLTWLTLPWALLLVWRLWRRPVSAALNAQLAATARFQAGLGMSLCVALWGMHIGA